MRSFDQLLALDFPHVDPERFEEWKQAGIDSSNNQMSINAIYTGALVVIFFLIRASNYIPIFFIIAFVGLLRYMVNMRFNQLSNELGITKGMIEKALKTDSFEGILTKPEITETPKKVSVSNLDANIKIEKNDDAISEESLLLNERQEESLVKNANQTSKMAFYILIFAGLAIVIAIIVVLNALLN